MIQRFINVTKLKILLLQFFIYFVTIFWQHYYIDIYWFYMYFIYNTNTTCQENYFTFCFTSMNFKTLFLTGLTALSLNTVKAQNVQDTIKKDTVTTLQQEKNDFKLTHLYAWSYAFGIFDKESLETGKIWIVWNIRAWARGVRKMSDKLSVNGLVAYDQNSWALGNMFYLTAVDYKAAEWTVITVWRTADAWTQMLALPVDPSGHLLFAAEQAAVNPGFGAKVNQKIGNASLVASWMMRQWGIEPSMMLQYWPFSWAVSQNPLTKKLQWGLMYVADLTNGANIFSMARLKPESVSFSWMYTTKNSIGMFVNAQYNRTEKSFDTFFVWALKSMKQKNQSAKLWAWYDVAQKNVQTVLFVTLGGKR